MDPTTLVTSFLIRTLAGYLAAAGQFDAAVRLLDWGGRRWPRLPELWALRGQVLLRWAAGPRAGRAVLPLLEGAVEAYGRAAELRPDLLEVRRERGLALLRLAWIGTRAQMRDPAELLHAAIGEYDTVLRTQTRRADVLHERGMALAALRPSATPVEGVTLLERALADLDASIRLRPHASEAIFHRAEISAELARLLHRLGRWAEERRLRLRSAADHAHLRQLRPDWLAPVLLEAIEQTALARLGDDPGARLRQAIDGASTVLAREARNVQAALVRADARLAAACRFADTGDERTHMVWKQAEADFESALAVVGLRNREDVLAEYAHAQADWAAVLHQTGEPQEALRVWADALTGMDRAVDDDPRNTARLLVRAEALLKFAAAAGDETGERRQQAREDVEAVLAEEPDSARALALRAQLRLVLEPEAATPIQEDIRRARQLAPEDGGILAAERHVLLGLAATNAGDARALLLHQVLRNCAVALRLCPDDSRAHLDQARALHLAGRAQAAYEALEQALGLAPGLRHEVRQDPTWVDVVHGEGFRRLVGAE